MLRRLATEGGKVIGHDSAATPAYDDLSSKARALRASTVPRMAMNFNVLGTNNCFQSAWLRDVEQVAFSSSIVADSFPRLQRVACAADTRGNAHVSARDIELNSII